MRNFLGATFLKQALYDLVDLLRPSLWREGREFPESGPAQRQLMNDGAIDLLESFDPAEAAVSIANQLLPATVRVYVTDKGDDRQHELRRDSVERGAQGGGDGRRRFLA